MYFFLCDSDAADACCSGREKEGERTTNHKCFHLSMQQIECHESVCVRPGEAAGHAHESKCENCG